MHDRKDARQELGFRTVMVFKSAEPEEAGQNGSRTGGSWTEWMQNRKDAYHVGQPVSWTGSGMMQIEGKQNIFSLTLTSKQPFAIQTYLTSNHSFYSFLLPPEFSLFKFFRFFALNVRSFDSRESGYTFTYYSPKMSLTTVL